MATLSLYFFNLLPLPRLDGAQLINVVLDFSLRHATLSTVDLEAIEIPRRHPRQRGQHVLMIIHLATTMLLGIATILTFLHWRGSHYP